MKNEISLPPEWLDLGDINGVAIGDRVATVDVKNGKVIVNSCGTVTAIEDKRIRTKNGSWLKEHMGAAPRFMYGSQFYYSANPKHIAQAEKQIEREKKAREKKEKEDKEKLSKFTKELNELLQKYGADLSISFGEYSDTHGIYDEKIEASIGNQSVSIETD